MAIKQFRARHVTEKPIEFEITYDKVSTITEVQDVLVNEDGSSSIGEVETFTQPESQLFHAVPEVPGKWLLEVGASMAGEEADRVLAINRFLDRVLTLGDKKRWNETMSDVDNILDMDMLAEITNWLIEVYSADRPTEPSRP